MFEDIVGDTENENKDEIENEEILKGESDISIIEKALSQQKKFEKALSQQEKFKKIWSKDVKKTWYPKKVWSTQDD